MSDGLTKDEVSAVAQKAGCAWLHEPLAQRFATLCRAPLVAENAALKQAHEINADTLNAMQVEIDDWKARALKAEQVVPKEWRDAVQEFVSRCESGEVRSPRGGATGGGVNNAALLHTSVRRSA